jgi:hypothetical protein
MHPACGAASYELRVASCELTIQLYFQALMHVSRISFFELVTRNAQPVTVSCFRRPMMLSFVAK